MIDSSGAVLCATCFARGQRRTMAWYGEGKLKLWDRHDGQRHEMLLDLEDILPPAESQEFAELVASMMRRLGAALQTA